MSNYLFEDDLIVALEEYTDISSAIKIFEDKKNAIREKIKKWREVNSIQEKVTITHGSDSWIIDNISQTRRSVRDYETLTKRLGKDAEIFITVTPTESLRITKR